MDIRLALIAGIDVPIPELELAVHQPAIKEIAYMGETDFFIGIQCLCLYKNMFVQDKEGLNDISNFQIFMTIMTEKETQDKKIAVLQVLELLFPGFHVLMTPMSIILQKDERNYTIDSSNFEILQDILREIFCAKTGPMDQQAFNPANEKAKEIADKLMRGRQRVAAQRSGENGSIFSRYLSLLTVGLNSMSLQDLIQLTVYQLYDLIERYTLYMNWDLDARTRLAGGKPDSQPDNWMKNIH